MKLVHAYPRLLILTLFQLPHAFTGKQGLFGFVFYLLKDLFIIILFMNVYNFWEDCYVLIQLIHSLNPT